MSFLGDAVHHPRRLFVRRMVFQVHLWAGVLLSLYLIAISLSGSVLVFKDEFVRWTLPRGVPRVSGLPTVSPEQMATHFAAAAPGSTLLQMQVPTVVLPVYLLEGKDAAGRPQRWFGNPRNASLLATPRTWVDVMHDLHYYLLLPTSFGMQVNGAGAAVLLLLTATGLVLWWPGLKVWTRGLRVNVRASWRRINYDLHSALGFWTLLLVSWWALSGVYFGWYRQVTAVVSAVSPLRGMVSPAPAVLPPAGSQRVGLAEVLQAAQRVAPQGKLWSVSDPLLQQADCYVLMDLAAPGDFSHRDIVRVRSADAAVLSVWHYGARHTLGDWVLWAMHPLHFGTLWGLGLKVIWALAGVCLAALTVTGVLMYWNRWLRKL